MVLREGAAPCAPFVVASSPAVARHSTTGDGDDVSMQSTLLLSLTLTQGSASLLLSFGCP